MVGTLTAGITWAIMRRGYLNAQWGFNADAQWGSSSHVKAKSSPLLFANHSSLSDVGNTTVNIYQGIKGHPGFITRCIDTGEVFSSQKKAADAFGIPEGVLSGHLNGKFDEANGLHFERVFAA